jgi:hypothetical protein
VGIDLLYIKKLNLRRIKTMPHTLFSTEILKEKLKNSLAKEVTEQIPQIWELLSTIGLCLVDTSSLLTRVLDKVEGNGTLGLIDQVKTLTIKIDDHLSDHLKDSEPIQPEKSNKDSFKLFVTWFSDKILPSLLVSLITVAFMLAYLAWNHIQLSNP